MPAGADQEEHNEPALLQGDGAFGVNVNFLNITYMDFTGAQLNGCI
jgi:hypothetical protein